MPDDLHNPHDKLFKHLLGDKENAASFLRNNLPQSLLSRLDLDRLEVLQASFVDSQYVQSEADLLFSVGVAGVPGFIYVLFEHQSSPDPLILLRLLSYMVRVWRLYTRQNPAARSLPVIIPLVLFHGPTGWQGPLDFHSLFDPSLGDLAPYTPDFRIKLFDLSASSKDSIAGNGAVRMTAAVLGALGKADFLNRIAKSFQALDELAGAPDFPRYFEILFRYILDVYDIPKQNLMDLATQSIGKGITEAVMTTYEQIKQEGRLEGRQEGEIEAKLKTAAIFGHLIARKFRVDPEPLFPLLKELEPSRYEQLSDKILEADDMEEIRNWLQSVSRN
jgi:predicted transposase YdaD